jgi:hypothetical protein
VVIHLICPRRAWTELCKAALHNWAVVPGRRERVHVLEAARREALDPRELDPEVGGEPVDEPRGPPLTRPDSGMIVNGDAAVDTNRRYDDPDAMRRDHLPAQPAPTPIAQAAGRRENEDASRRPGHDDVR